MLSAFGVDHGEISKGLNPLKAIKGVRAAKQVKQAEHAVKLDSPFGGDHPFGAPSSATKAKMAPAKMMGGAPSARTKMNPTRKLTYGINRNNVRYGS